MYRDLPDHARNAADRAYRLFQRNPGHPGLHFKKVDDETDMYSARVGIGYRALGRLEGDAIVWFWIGPHSEYDKLLP
jgi:hypothetical protein